ncbi:MAG TPA: hypothetical protein VFE33_32950 [Thermoanaerobaculia bacterium]|nr:hypothetical protein [Thermoanaerobaculia bacterium]
MAFLPRLASLWKNWRHRDRAERDLDAEIGAYLEMLTAEKIQDV